jgi:hypothetical protein
MIRKVLLLAATLFCLYSVFLPFIGPRLNATWPAPANMFQMNVVKAQQFIYDRRDSEAVIVGSSLASLLVQPFLSEKCFNLALIGYSVYDGLEVIKRCGAKPRIIFIETNWIERGPNEQNTEMLFLPGLYTVRKYLPALREDNRPDNVLLRPILAAWFSLIAVRSRTKGTQVGGDDAERRRTVRQGRLKIELAFHAEVPNAAVLDRLIEELESYARYFETYNVRIVFFQMPVDKMIHDSAAMRAIRSALSQHFPEERYSYLPLPARMDFETDDGIHLLPESAIEYTKFFNARAQEYLR